MPLYGKFVLITKEGEDGAQFPLTVSTCLFGRGRNCDIIIQSPNVIMREHCRVDVDQDERVLLTNHSISNPVLLNTESVHRTARLQHRDVLTVGHRSFRFEYPPISPYHTTHLKLSAMMQVTSSNPPVAKEIPLNMLTQKRMTRSTVIKGKTMHSDALFFIEKQEDPDGLSKQFINAHIGYGLFAKRTFQKGDFIAEYRGQYLSAEEGERREKQYEVEDGSFLYFFKPRGARNIMCIDATECDSFARFANDSHLKPEAKMETVFDRSGKPHLCLFAARDIAHGQEIRYDYGVKDLPWRKKAKVTASELYKLETGGSKDEQMPLNMAESTDIKAACELESSGNRNDPEQMPFNTEEPAGANIDCELAMAANKDDPEQVPFNTEEPTGANIDCKLQMSGNKDDPEQVPFNTEEPTGEKTHCEPGMAGSRDDPEQVPFNTEEPTCKSTHHELWIEGNNYDPDQMPFKTEEPIGANVDCELLMAANTDDPEQMPFSTEEPTCESTRHELWMEGNKDNPDHMPFNRIEPPGANIDCDLQMSGNKDDPEQVPFNSEEPSGENIDCELQMSRNKDDPEQVPFNNEEPSGENMDCKLQMSGDKDDPEQMPFNSEEPSGENIDCELDMSGNKDDPEQVPFNTEEPTGANIDCELDMSGNKDDPEQVPFNTEEPTGANIDCKLQMSGNKDDPEQVPFNTEEPTGANIDCELQMSGNKDDPEQVPFNTEEPSGENIDCKLCMSGHKDDPEQVPFNSEEPTGANIDCKLQMSGNKDDPEQVPFNTEEPTRENTHYELWMEGIKDNPKHIPFSTEELTGEKAHCELEMSGNKENPEQVPFNTEKPTGEKTHHELWMEGNKDDPVQMPFNREVPTGEKLHCELEMEENKDDPEQMPFNTEKSTGAKTHCELEAAGTKNDHEQMPFNTEEPTGEKTHCELDQAQTKDDLKQKPFNGNLKQIQILHPSKGTNHHTLETLRVAFLPSSAGMSTPTLLVREVVSTKVVDLTQNAVDSKLMDAKYNEPVNTRGCDIPKTCNDTPNTSADNLSDQTGQDIEIVDDSSDDNSVVLEYVNGHSKSASEVCDYENSLIKMPAILQQDTTISGHQKKNARVWNLWHYCLYCEYAGNNISRHLRKKHAEEDEIKSILEFEQAVTGESTKEKAKIVSDRLELLRMRGDHLHNTRVMKEQQGDLVVARRRKGDFSVEDYGPCTECYSWILLTELGRHQKGRCIAATVAKDVDTSAGVLRSRSRFLKGVVEGAHYNSASQMLKGVISNMQSGPDNIKDVVVKDRLIVRLGEEWLSKCSRNSLRRGNYTSDRMRRCAKLLIKCSKRGTEMQTMDDVLKPDHTEQLIEAVLDMSGGQGQFVMKTPSVALKLRDDLLRMAAIKQMFAIKESDIKREKEAKQFVKVFERDWNIRLGVTARNVMQERRFNKKSTLPDPRDIKELSEHLKRSLCDLGETLTNSPDWPTYTKAITLTQSRIATYNRRRPGEVESILLETFMAVMTDEETPDVGLVEEQLSSLEKELVKTQKMAKVRGKKGSCVPVLFPNDTFKALQYISSSAVREQLGVNGARNDEGKHFLFANRGKSVFRVCDSLREITKEAEEKFSCISSLKCTALRKFLATTMQMLDLHDSELKWVLKHLGHSFNVHENYYRSLQNVLEKAKVAKLLLLADSGKIGTFLGKRLEDISYEDIDIPDMPEEGDDNIEEMQSRRGDKWSDTDITEEGDDGNIGEMESIRGSKCPGKVEKPRKLQEPQARKGTNREKGKGPEKKSGKKRSYPWSDSDPDYVVSDLDDISDLDLDGSCSTKPASSRDTTRPRCAAVPLVTKKPDVKAFPPKKTKRKFAGRAQWTNDQNFEVQKIFKDFIKHKVIPNRSEVEDRRRQFSTLKDKHYRKIVFKINNIITKEKQK